MIISKRVCDTCGKELREGWEDRAGGLFIQFEKSCCNKVHELPFSTEKSGYQKSETRYEDLCFNCQQKVEKILVDALTKINDI